MSPTLNPAMSNPTLYQPGIVQVHETMAEEQSPQKSRTIKFPQECIVGSIGDFARTMAKGSQVPPEFYFACGLTLIGAMAGTNLTIDIRYKAEPRLYTVLLGGSGIVKKSTAMKASIEFFSSLKNPLPAVCYGVASAEGLVTALNKSSGRLVLAYDELRTLVDKCTITGSTLLPAVTSLFEQNKWHNMTKRDKGSVLCDDAHLSIIGCCTEDTYKHIWTSAAIGIGLTNRLFIVLSDGGPLESWPKPVPAQDLTPIRDRIQVQLATLPKQMEPTPEALEVWEKWFYTPRPSTHASRLDVIGVRLMALVALTTDKKVIDAETVDIVCRMLDYELDVRMLTDPIDADGTIAKLEESVRRVLRVKGKLTRNQLRQATNADKYGIWAFDQALKNLAGSAKDICEANGV